MKNSFYYGEKDMLLYAAAIAFLAVNHHQSHVCVLDPYVLNQLLYTTRENGEKPNGQSRFRFRGVEIFVRPPATRLWLGRKRR